VEREHVRRLALVLLQDRRHSPRQPTIGRYHRRRMW
jgi:hypothetical protein